MIQSIMAEKKALIDRYLETILSPDCGEHKILYEAMNYSLLAGGKRIRPSLFLLLLEEGGLDPEMYMDAACALECIHTYSLIHDDLPAMDNDEFRRGRLTNHKVYGAGMATLAGDGLLTFAFQLLSRQKGISPDVCCELVRILAEAAGPAGMVGGQAQDISSEHRRLSLEELRVMDACKTGCLLCAPVDMAAAVLSLPGEERDILAQWGRHIGLLFQITDDMLDVSGTLEQMGKKSGQDEVMDKPTYVTVLGYGEAARKAQDEAQQAAALADRLPVFGRILRDLPLYLIERTK